MNFNDAYMQLEDEFRERVAEDRKQWKFESVYLPNVAPEAPVDYVLIGMEPSLRTWAGIKKQDFNERMRTAQEKIDDGFRNFCGVWTLHHPVKEYLCREGEAYYVTDLAKGAMLTSSPGAGDDKKYDAWYPLLEKELGLVAKPDAKIISIGHRVSRFLSEKNVHSHAGTVPHYSTQAARYWGREADRFPCKFRKFAGNLNTVPGATCLPGHVCRPASNARNVRLSVPRKKLLFEYKVRFNRIRNRETSGWRQEQRKWQSLLT